MEELIFDFLKNNEFFPFSILYFTIKDIELLKISFYRKADLNKLEELLDYHYSSDRSGLIEFERTNTVLIKGSIFSKLINLVSKWKSNE